MPPGTYYWVFDYQTGQWNPNPENNPDGRHGQPPSQPPPDYNPQQATTGGSYWESLGLQGGDGTAWWISSMMDSMRMDPGRYGLAPEDVTDELFMGLIQDWNSMPLDDRHGMLGMNPVSPTVIDDIQGYQEGLVQPQAPSTPQAPAGGGIQPPSPGGDPTWAAGKGQEAFTAAYNEWKAGGRQGPPPTIEEFGATRDSRGMPVWDSPGGTEPGGGTDPNKPLPQVGPPDTQIIGGKYTDLKGGQGASVPPGSGGPSLGGVMQEPGGPSTGGVMPEPGGGQMSNNASDYAKKNTLGGGSIGGGASTERKRPPGVVLQGKQPTYGGQPRKKKFEKKYGGSLYGGG